MVEFLFGWLTKPEYLQTGLDRIVQGLELLIIFFIVIAIVYYIAEKY